MTISVWAQRAIQLNIEWFDDAYEALRLYCKTHEALTSELFRATYNVEPENSNSWGALMLMAKERGIIKDSGRTMNAQSDVAKGRRVIVWLSTIFEEVQVPR
jgi:hypothetical protein